MPPPSPHPQAVTPAARSAEPGAIRSQSGGGDAPARTQHTECRRRAPPSPRVIPRSSPSGVIPRTALPRVIPRSSLSPRHPARSEAEMRDRRAEGLWGALPNEPATAVAPRSRISRCSSGKTQGEASRPTPTEGANGSRIFGLRPRPGRQPRGKHGLAPPTAVMPPSSPLPPPSSRRHRPTHRPSPRPRAAQSRGPLAARAAAATRPREPHTKNALPRPPPPAPSRETGAQGRGGRRRHPRRGALASSAARRRGCRRRAPH